MNQYADNIEFYNYVNNNYNKPLFTENSDVSKLYDPYQGYIRGNMFVNLYNAYKEKNPFNIKIDNEKEELLNYLNALSFAAHDINLYLDIYPDDKDMLNLFVNYRMEANKLMGQYEEMYGPLLVNSKANTKYPWMWDNKPWPWEN